MSAPAIAGGGARLAWAALALGTLLALAGLGLGPGGEPALPADAVALVGDEPIARAEWLRAIAAVEQDRGVALDVTAQREILERLIDEELLRQHALRAGLARDDPALRKALVRAVLDSLQQGVEAEAADPQALQGFHDEHRAFFQPQPQWLMRAARPAVAGAVAPAALERALCHGDVALPAGFVPLPIPAAPLPLARLAGYAGATLAAAAPAATPRKLQGPLPGGGDYFCVIPVLAGVVDDAALQAAVRDEFLRRRAEAAAAQLLTQLREEIRVQKTDAPR